MKVTVGKNKYCCWLKVGERKIIVSWAKLEDSYANRLMIKFLSFYTDLTEIHGGKRVKLEIPDELLEKALAIRDLIDKHRCARFRGFREGFAKIEIDAKTPQEQLDALQGLVQEYVTRDVLQKMSE